MPSVIAMAIAAPPHLDVADQLGEHACRRRRHDGDSASSRAIGLRHSAGGVSPVM
jgi:hypothetical protein